jgi:DNA-binding XRE family transcriptional regulator
VPCAACGRDIVSAGALPTDAGSAVCLRCLARRPGAPFAQRLKSHRLAAGLTKAELAKRAAMTHNTVRHYESGAREPRWKHLARLVRVLGSGLVTGGLTETA